MLDFITQRFIDFFGYVNNTDVSDIAVFISIMLVIAFIYLGLKLVFPNVTKYRNFVFGVIIIVSAIIYLFTALNIDLYISEYLVILQDYSANMGNTQTFALLGGV